MLFLGSRDQDTLVDYYTAASVVVVPSHYESFGMVALEAMACGTPVIASDVGGLSLNIADGFNGYLVASGDVEELAYKITLLLTQDELRRQLGRQARGGLRGSVGRSSPPRRWPPMTWLRAARRVITLPCKMGRERRNTRSAYVPESSNLRLRRRPGTHIAASNSDSLGAAPGSAPGEASELVFGGESGRAAQHGWISDAEHWAFIQRRLELDDATLAQFRRDFFAEDGIDTDLLAYIDRLRSGYRLGLLSNATAARGRFFNESGIADHFDAITISGEEGVMKPDERIYRIALGRLNVKPNEAIFVDDFSENVAAARVLGMTGVHFTDPQQARRELMILTGVE